MARRVIYNAASVGVVFLLCLSIISNLHWFADKSQSKLKMDTPESLYYNRKPNMFIHQQRETSEYIKEMDSLNIQKVNMDDPRLISLIRNYWIENPSDQPYNLKFPDTLDPSVGQAAFVDNRLNFKDGGFYVECGALDGETRSNTLIFERSRNWNGLLIEADPSNYKLLKGKHRKAFTINACLSIYPYPVKMQFKQQYNLGRLMKNPANSKDGGIVDVQCFPFYSILRAINVTQVDFFSLDVEGDELKVLQTIPFDKVDIEMMTVEFKHIDKGENSLKQFVEDKGYSSLLKVSHYGNFANDIIFRKHL